MLLTGNVEKPGRGGACGGDIEGVRQRKTSWWKTSSRCGPLIQVNLRVRIVEMNRNVTRALGIDWQAMGSIGKFALNFGTINGLGDPPVLPRRANLRGRPEGRERD